MVGGRDGDVVVGWVPREPPPFEDGPDLRGGKAEAEQDEADRDLAVARRGDAEEVVEERRRLRGRDRRQGPHTRLATYVPAHWSGAVYRSAR